MHLLKWIAAPLAAAILILRLLTLDFAALPAAIGGATGVGAATGNSSIEQAELLAQSDPAAAQAVLAEAIRATPSDGRGYVLLGALREQSDRQNAVILVTTGEQLTPDDLTTQLAAAAFWARRGNLQAAMAGWSRALDARPELAPALYPLLSRVAETARHRSALRAIAARSPSWWPGFFRHLAANAAVAATVREVFRWRRPQLPAEWAAWLHRLQRDQRWIEAHFVWLNRVGNQLLQPLANIYNGDFERPLSNTGFGWQATAAAGLEIDTSYVQGLFGAQALHLSFNGEPLVFQHLRQYLELSSGQYQLTGYAHTSNLVDTAGLHWVVRCLDGTLLNASRRFAGKLHWQLFRTELTIPDGGCEVQELVLESAENKPFAAIGELWFDNLSLQRLTPRSS